MKETVMPGALAPGVPVPSSLAPASDPVPAIVPAIAPAGGLRRTWASRFHDHPHLFDAGLAVIIFLVTAGGLINAHRMSADALPPLWAWIATAIACLSLLFRRTHPWPVLVVTAVGYLLLQATSHDVPPLILAVVTALVTLTLAGQRRGAIIAAVAVTGTALAIGSVVDAEYWSHPRPVAVAALCALAIALADAVRNRRAYVAAVEERARRAEESREQEARRRVGDERLRIARELHDVLAHHIAVVNVQAGVAGHLLERDPVKAREALDHVRAAARSVLSEMQAVVTVLREPGEPAEPIVPAEPSPGLDRIGDLIEGFRGVGLRIDTAVSGTPHQLPAAADLVAYRAVQEALTNVHKHAGNADVVVAFDYRGAAVDITVTNAGTGDESRAAGRRAATTTGFGLMGMRERVGSVGGSLRAGPMPGGGFVTALSLPTPTQLPS